MIVEGIVRGVVHWENATTKNDREIDQLMVHDLNVDMRVYVRLYIDRIQVLWRIHVVENCHSPERSLTPIDLWPHYESIKFFFVCFVIVDWHSTWSLPIDRKSLFELHECRFELDPYPFVSWLDNEEMLYSWRRDMKNPRERTKKFYRTNKAFNVSRQET